MYPSVMHPSGVALLRTLDLNPPRLLHAKISESLHLVRGVSEPMQLDGSLDTRSVKLDSNSSLILYKLARYCLNPLD
jgi:hypothetical protein